MAAARMAARWRYAAPVAATVVGAAVVYPRRTAFAEAPSSDSTPSRKPIYDVPSVTVQKSVGPPPSKPADQTPSSPTPTDRLAVQVGKVRLFLYENAKGAEKSFNDFVSWVLQHETDASNTIASLAPPKESGEQLLPGVIYVLVATMAGSIVTRNRNILIRSTFPLAVGVAAGWYLIPITMNNISELAWEYEKKVPAVAETHETISHATREAWRHTKTHTAVAGRWVDQTVSDARTSVEDWVKKGK